jgi:S1-C subfamily serine protease
MVAMINLDMVGRLGDGPLIVSGVDTAEEWRALLEPAAADAGISVATRGEGYGPSDHTSFYLKDVPVLHLFTNTHADYHKPSDDWQKVDVPGLSRVSALVAGIARGAANGQGTLTLVRGAGRPPSQGQASVGYGAYLGSVPDFTPVDRGVKLSGVTPGSPADTAGLRAGDIILGMGDHDVADLQAMTDALRAHKPGDTLTVRFQRADQARTVEVTLGSRAAR